MELLSALTPVALANFITYKSFKTYKSRIRVALERFDVLFFTINRAYFYSLLNQSAFTALFLIKRFFAQPREIAAKATYF